LQGEKGMKGYNAAFHQWQFLLISDAWEGLASRQLAGVHFEDLVAGIQHPSTNVRIVAAKLMGLLGDTRAFPFLKRLLNDHNANQPSFFQADEEEIPETPSNAAAEAIRRLQQVSR
jgi:HEAT repeat protein